MRFIFITHTHLDSRPYEDVSSRYRCFHPANALVDMGHKALVISRENFEKYFERMPSADIYIFHRPLLTDKMALILERLRSRAIVAADFDDIIFNPELAAQIPGFNRSIFVVNVKRQNLSRFNYGAGLFDNFSLSTRPLQDSVDKIFNPKKSIVIHNAFPSGFAGLCHVARKNNPWEKRKYLFGYMSGTKTHNRDFELIKPLLLEKLRASGEKLLLAGPVLPDDPEVNNCANIVRHDLVPFQKLPALMAQCRYLLAPLEITPFSVCKSGIKFYEGALCGCIVMATPIPDLERFNSPLLIKRGDQGQWRKAIFEAGSHKPDFEKEISILLPQISSQAEARKFIDFFAREARGI